MSPTESCGVPRGEKCLNFLSDLGDIAASDGRARKATFVRSLRQELSRVLFRGNGGIFFQSTFSIARAVFRQFTPGCEFPINKSGEV